MKYYQGLNGKIFLKLRHMVNQSTWSSFYNHISSAIKVEDFSSIDNKAIEHSQKERAGKGERNFLFFCAEVGGGRSL